MLIILQEMGLSELREGAANNNLRSFLSTVTLLTFHLYITVILGENTFGLGLLRNYIKSLNLVRKFFCTLIFFPQVLVKETLLRRKLC